MNCKILMHWPVQVEANITRIYWNSTGKVECSCIISCDLCVMTDHQEDDEEQKRFFSNVVG